MKPAIVKPGSLAKRLALGAALVALACVTLLGGAARANTRRPPKQGPSLKVIQGEKKQTLRRPPGTFKDLMGMRGRPPDLKRFIGHASIVAKTDVRTRFEAHVVRVLDDRETSSPDITSPEREAAEATVSVYGRLIGRKIDTAEMDDKALQWTAGWMAACHAVSCTWAARMQAMQPDAQNSVRGRTGDDIGALISDASVTSWERRPKPGMPFSYKTDPIQMGANALMFEIDNRYRTAERRYAREIADARRLRAVAPALSADEINLLIGGLSVDEEEIERLIDNELDRRLGL